MAKGISKVRLEWLAIYCFSLLVGTIIAAMAGDNANHRATVDVAIYPWSSVGKIYNSTGGACTGTLIAQDKVLTAAHCVFNARTRNFIRPELIHFLLGYDRGSYRVHLTVSRYELGPGYDATTAAKTSTSDWAILTTTPLAGDDIRPLNLAIEPPTKNAPVMLPGFAQDHAFVMTADTDCRIVGSLERGSLIVSDCVAVRGDSGAPLLVPDENGTFHVVGVQSATAHIGGFSRSIAVASTSPGLSEAAARR